MSKKWLEMTYNKQEITWTDLHQASSKKWFEMTYNKQETTWNDQKQHTFLLFLKLISNFFDLIFFMGVAFNSSFESRWGSASMGACGNSMKAGSVWLSAAPVVI